MTRAVKQTCPQCGRTYFNRGAHLEECRGPLPPLDDALICECGHPHVNPDGSGSCSVFLCQCRAFAEARA